MDGDRLKPCPFCGKPTFTFSKSPFAKIPHEYATHVSEGCPLDGLLSKIDDWNRRVPEQQPNADTKRLDWLMPKISGRAWREIGVNYGSGCNRESIDNVMVSEQGEDK